MISNYIPRVYSTALWPILGFFFMPYTVLAYAIAMNEGGLHGFGLILFVLGVLTDLGVIGSAGNARKRTPRQSS